MKVLIVSDTHGQDENLEETVLREAPFDYLIHCGDVEGRSNLQTGNGCRGQFDVS